MTIGPKTRIRFALQAVNQEISGHASRGGDFAGALAGEGWSGGYAQALMDVQLVLNGNVPNTRHYWVIKEQDRAKELALEKGKP